MRERARRAFSRFADMLPEEREGIRLLGTSGTVTTLASVHLSRSRPTTAARSAKHSTSPSRRCRKSAG